MLPDLLATLYLERICGRVSADECAAQHADLLLVELMCNFMLFTVEPFAAPMRELLEPLAQNMADTRQRERRFHACVHSQDLMLLGQLSVAL